MSRQVDQLRANAEHYFSTEDTNRFIREVEKYTGVRGFFSQLENKDGVAIIVVMVVGNSLLEIELTESCICTTITRLSSIASIKTREAGGYFNLIIGGLLGPISDYDTSTPDHVRALRDLSLVLIGI